MGTDTIRSIIATALAFEHQHHRLQRAFEGRLPELSVQLQLPSKHTASRLVDFVAQYIGYVPDFLDLVRSSPDNCGRNDLVAPALNLAEDFFLAPPDAHSREQDLEALLDEAFLAQRLLEEVNERQLRLGRPPLLSFDLTRANIIVHHLLGDEAANRLDTLVDSSLEMLLSDGSRFASYHEQPDHVAPELRAWQELPCLSRNADIDLRLGAP